MRTPCLLLAGTLLAAMASALAADATATITIPSEVPFAPDFEISDAAKEECDLGATQSENVKGALSDAGYQVTTQDDLTESAPGKVLLMEFSSGKSTGRALDTFHERSNFLIITGCLYESGKVKASFMDSRVSTGGVGGEFKKTCAILHKIEKVMGDDIGKWLANNPPIFAMLGDAARGKVDLPPKTPPFCMMSGKITPEMKEQWRQQQQQQQQQPKH